MNTSHGLKVGDLIKPPNGVVYNVLEVEGRFALVQSSTGDTYPIVFADEGWCTRIGSTLPEFMDAVASEVAEAIVDLLNERFPA